MLPSGSTIGLFRILYFCRMDGCEDTRVNAHEHEPRIEAPEIRLCASFVGRLDCEELC